MTVTNAWLCDQYLSDKLETELPEKFKKEFINLLVVAMAVNSGNYCSSYFTY
jgi:hypothetical protein